MKDQREFGINVRKEKVEDERRLSVSVMNSPSPFVQGWAWPLCWPMQGSPTMAHTYLQSLYGI